LCSFIIFISIFRKLNEIAINKTKQERNKQTKNTEDRIVSEYILSVLNVQIMCFWFVSVLYCFNCDNAFWTFTYLSVVNINCSWKWNTCIMFLKWSITHTHTHTHTHKLLYQTRYLRFYSWLYEESSTSTLIMLYSCDDQRGLMVRLYYWSIYVLWLSSIQYSVLPHWHRLWESCWEWAESCGF
jgi:hypothetical protein